MAEDQYDNNNQTDQIRKTTILLADDHPLMRLALRTVLEKQNDFEVIGEAGNGEEAIQMSLELEPDVVIMDISMPHLNGLEATRQIKDRCPQIAVLILTVHNDSEHIMGVLEVGAAGYLTKDAFDQEIVHAVRGVVAGEAVLSPPILEKLMHKSLQQPARVTRYDDREELSARELEVLKLAAKGLSNKDIAESLDLRLRTVKGYLVNIFSKLRVGSRTEAVVAGLKSGFLTLDDLK
jgi:two-component system, NarL family, response regulator LiaR